MEDKLELPVLFYLISFLFAGLMHMQILKFKRLMLTLFFSTPPFQGCTIKWNLDLTAVRLCC